MHSPVKQTIQHFAVMQADRKDIPRYRQELFDLHVQGKLQAWVDEREFVGVESVVDAIEYMLTGEGIGKVVVRMH